MSKREKIGRAADITIGAIEVLVILAVGAGIFSAWWGYEGRPVAQFGNASEITIQPAPAGGQTLVTLPIMLLRDCRLPAGSTISTVRQGDLVLRNEPAGGIGEPGMVGVWNKDFSFPSHVPTILEPGPATMTWHSVWHCGLRQVETSTPAVSFEVLASAE